MQHRGDGAKRFLFSAPPPARRAIHRIGQAAWRGAVENPSGPLCAREALLEARTQRRNTQASVALFKLGRGLLALRYAPTNLEGLKLKEKVFVSPKGLSLKNSTKTNLSPQHTRFEGVRKKAKSMSAEKL